MKKLLSMLLVLTAVGAIGLIYTSTTYAAASDNAYVVVKCTMTTSVLVVSSNNYVAINNGVAVGPNEIWVSSYVQVQNNGAGSITNWSLMISTQHYAAAVNGPWLDTTTTNVGWGYGATLAGNGLNQVVLAAVFKNAAAALQTDFANDDVLTQINQYYDAGAASFGPAAGAYLTDYTSPNNYNMIANTGVSTRNLFFYMRTPTGVTDQNYHRIQVTVTAAIGL